VEALAPGLDLEHRPWRPLHPRAWRRVFKHYLILAALAAAVLAWPLRLWIVVPAACIVAFGWFAARGWSRFAAWSLHDGVLAFREGWLSRTWTSAKVMDGHVVALEESPFDRRRAMAAVRLDTAGAAADAPLRVPYLPVETARELHDAIRTRLVAAHPR
jgi:putative membrane protein